jgi:phosphate transport system substrate-binding protein
MAKRNNSAVDVAVGRCYNPPGLKKPIQGFGLSTAGYAVPKRLGLSVFLLFVLFLVSGCRPPGNRSSGGASLQNVGSDTIVNLALAWAEAYTAEHPDVRISVTGGGSGTGIAALINGTVDIANASRKIKPEEVESAQANGISPVEHVIARDAIAIVIHPDNPVDQLTIQQLSDIYSGVITNWSEVGGEDRPIVLLSRESNSGTHVYFLEQVVRQGNQDDTTLFSADTLLLPSSEGISTEVRQNPNAIGYDGLGYVTPDQKVVAVAREPSGPFVLPSVESVNRAEYPISRDLYMYTVGEPSGLIAEYLDWVAGERAQAIVAELGFVPLRQQEAGG